MLLTSLWYTLNTSSIVFLRLLNKTIRVNLRVPSHAFGSLGCSVADSDRVLDYMFVSVVHILGAHMVALPFSVTERLHVALQNTEQLPNDDDFQKAALSVWDAVVCRSFRCLTNAPLSDDSVPRFLSLQSSNFMCWKNDFTCVMIAFHARV